MKKARVKIYSELLHKLLSLPDDIEIELVYTPNESKYFKSNMFEIRLAGEGLPEEFTVCEGCQIMQADILITTDTKTSEKKAEII